MIHKPVAKGSGHSFAGKIQRTLEGFLEENEEGNRIEIYIGANNLLTAIIYFDVFIQIFTLIMV